MLYICLDWKNKKEEHQNQFDMEDLSELFSFNDWEGEHSLETIRTIFYKTLDNYIAYADLYNLEPSELVCVCCDSEIKEPLMELALA